MQGENANKVIAKCGELCVAAAVLVPVALIFEGLPTMLNPKTLLALIYLGILPTGVAQLILTQVVRDAGPVQWCCQAVVVGRERNYTALS